MSFHIKKRKKQIYLRYDNTILKIFPLSEIGKRDEKRENSEIFYKLLPFNFSKQLTSGPSSLFLQVT